VSLAGAGTQISGPGGAFAFPAVTPGFLSLSVALLGYTELHDSLRVEAASDLELTLPLSVTAVALEPIVVAVRRRPVGPLEGFERRRENQRGTFLSRAEIEAANPNEFTDLLRPLPGIRLIPTSTFGHTVRFRGGCIPDLWLDGAQVGATADVDSFLRTEDLEAVEVYRGPDLPGEFGSNLCGAIVAWTRRGTTAQERARGANIRRQLIMAGSIALAFLGIRLIG